MARYLIADIFQVNWFNEQWSLADSMNTLLMRYRVNNIFEANYLDELSQYGLFYDNRLQFSRQHVKMTIVGTNASNV